jgi:hypothetical protein
VRNPSNDRVRKKEIDEEEDGDEGTEELEGRQCRNRRRKRRKDQGEEEQWERCGETCERRKTKERMRERRKIWKGLYGGRKGSCSLNSTVIAE